MRRVRLRRFGSAPLLVAALVAAGLAFPTGPGATTPAAASSAPAGPAPAFGLPDGVPAAATRPEPRLPVPHGWPFPESFPRTSGTGRLGGGASFWSDFVYDDHGAIGLPDPAPVANLAPQAFLSLLRG